jgi:hypothetical protein
MPRASPGAERLLSAVERGFPCVDATATLAAATAMFPACIHGEGGYCAALRPRTRVDRSRCHGAAQDVTSRCRSSLPLRPRSGLAHLLPGRKLARTQRHRSCSWVVPRHASSELGHKSADLAGSEPAMRYRAVAPKHSNFTSQSPVATKRNHPAMNNMSNGQQDLVLSRTRAARTESLRARYCL